MAQATESRVGRAQLQEELQQMGESSRLQVADLLDKLDGKTKAGIKNN